MKSLSLYFQETTPLKEKVFNSYMDKAVNLYNEEFLAKTIRECAGQIGVVDIALRLNRKWQELVQSN